jgi:septum formation protein
MTKPADAIVLASRSPRRRELLSLIVPAASIVVRPPSDPDEPGFEGLTTREELLQRLRQIAERKRRGVAAELTESPRAIVAADTVIIVEDGPARFAVLGQPPPPPDDRSTVRDWFLRYYFGRTHQAVTSMAVSNVRGEVRNCEVSTRVTFSNRHNDWLDWYLASGEPAGKAGGYAIQGLGSLFVERVEGSLSNVVGLPLAETTELLVKLGVVAAPALAGE